MIMAFLKCFNMQLFFFLSEFLCATPTNKLRFKSFIFSDEIKDFAFHKRAPSVRKKVCRIAFIWEISVSSLILGLGSVLL